MCTCPIWNVHRHIESRMLSYCWSDSRSFWKICEGLRQSTGFPPFVRTFHSSGQTRSNLLGNIQIESAICSLQDLCLSQMRQQDADFSASSSIQRCSQEAVGFQWTCKWWAHAFVHICNNVEFLPRIRYQDSCCQGGRQPGIGANKLWAASCIFVHNLLSSSPYSIHYLLDFRSIGL